MSDVSAEDVQNWRQLRYEEMQKIKSQLKEQDQKWQDVSMLCIGRRGDGETGRRGKCVCLTALCFPEKKVGILERIFLAVKELSFVENVINSP